MGWKYWWETTDYKEKLVCLLQMAIVAIPFAGIYYLISTWDP